MKISRLAFGCAFSALTLAISCCQAVDGSPFHRELTLVPVAGEEHGGGGGCADEKPDDTTNLAKAAQNPVSDLVSLPLQNNFNFGVGPENGVNYTLNIQPIYPTPLSDKWNLINRAIVPLMDQPELAPGLGDVFGLGDSNTSRISHRCERCGRNGLGVFEPQKRRRGASKSLLAAASGDYCVDTTQKPRRNTGWIIVVCQTADVTTTGGYL